MSEPASAPPSQAPHGGQVARSGGSTGGSPRHLLDIQSQAPEVLQAMLDDALTLVDNPEALAGAGRDRLLINLFYEPSTRTRVSFEVAALRLGMRVVNIAASDSSVKKGETLMDTFRTLEAMAPDLMVIRHPDNDALQPLAEAAQSVSIINAGDGSRAHPTQALLDALTLRRRFERLDRLKVLVAGDLHHSRVTRSNVALFKKLGIGEIRLCAPAGLEAGPRVSTGTRCFSSLDQALEGVDVVMMLRIQHERLAGMAIPDGESYHRQWGLTSSRLKLAAPGCLVMHPGPMNRGVEISSEVADGPQSVILE
jgi:aspartate carbamoyltransferase catalytic subunit